MIIYEVTMSDPDVPGGFVSIGLYAHEERANRRRDDAIRDQWELQTGEKIDPEDDDLDGWNERLEEEYQQRFSVTERFVET